MSKKAFVFYPCIRVYCSALISSQEEYSLSRILHVRNVMACLNEHPDELLEEFISSVEKQGLNIAVKQYREIFDSEHENFINSCSFLKK